MLTVDDYGAIQRARRDGKSIRQIASDFNHSRNTIRLILQHPEPNPSPRNYSAPVLGPFQALIDQILLDDEEAPPSNATPPCRCFVACKMNTGTTDVTARCNAMCTRTDAAIARRSSLWGTCQANASRPILATSTSISPMAGGRFLSWSRPGLLERSLRSGSPLRAHRGDPRRHGQGLRVPRLRPQGGLVEQPQDRCHAHPSRTRTPAPSPLRRAGQPLRLRSPLLHARSGQREACGSTRWLQWQILRSTC